MTKLRVRQPTPELIDWPKYKYAGPAKGQRLGWAHDDEGPESSHVRSVEVITTGTGSTEPKAKYTVVPT